MSQIKTLTKEGKELHYGLDQVLGYFITVYDLQGEPELEYDNYGMMSGSKGKKSVGEQVEFLRETLVNPQEHESYFSRMLLDLDPHDPNEKGWDSTGLKVL